MQNLALSRCALVRYEMRFAVIDLLDIIFFESNDPIECFEIYDLWGSSFMRGVYDYEQDCYLERADLVDLCGVSICTMDGDTNG